MAFGTNDEVVQQGFGKNDEIIAPANAVSQAPQEAPGWFQPGSQSEALVRGASQGATLGFGDEIQAGIRSVTGQQPGESILDAYRRLRDEQRTANSASAQANPATYTAGTIAGSLPSAVAAPSTGIIKGLGFNAITGALAGAGNSDAQTAGGVATDALKDGAITAGLGVAGRTAGDLVQRTANGLKSVADLGSAKVLAKSADQSTKAIGDAALAGGQQVASFAADNVSHLKDVLPSAWNTTKAVYSSAKENLGKGVTGGDAMLGTALSAMLGPHVGVPLAIAKKAMFRAGKDAAGEHSDEIWHAARPMVKVLQQKFAPVIDAAVSKGTPFAAINYTLSQQSPEYREMIRAQEKLKEEGSDQ